MKNVLPPSSIATLSVKTSLCPFAEAGSDASSSVSASDIPLTTMGEKIFSSPRMRCLSITCVVTFATKTFWFTCCV